MCQSSRTVQGETDRQSRVLPHSAKVSEFNKHSNVQRWKLIYLDIYRLLCFSFSQTFGFYYFRYKDALLGIMISPFIQPLGAVLSLSAVCYCAHAHS